MVNGLDRVAVTNTAELEEKSYIIVWPIVSFVKNKCSKHYALSFSTLSSMICCEIGGNSNKYNICILTSDSMIHLLR
jgi:hypothetical protein